jgi:para-nitrobenzyl esterase
MLSRYTSRFLPIVLSGVTVSVAWTAGQGPDRVRVAEGVLEGTGPQGKARVREFKGIPFAEPPVGKLRWRPPQPPAQWTGVRKGTAFGPRCTQQALYGDMNFRSNGMSEDCLYLNVWTAAKSADARLPVMVYFYGGGFAAGDGSEPRYDGESMAARGIVSVTVNYRLGVFGFFAHPELTADSVHHASGNWALLDQTAALHWVHANIAAFGGDPGRVTIAGESAGSIAVSALMASPLSRDLIAGAIGESGSILAALAPVPLQQAEEQGVKFASALGAANVAALRAMTTEQILEAAGKRDTPRFGTTIDGYFFTESPLVTFAAGRQAHVPLLAGWNSEEANARSVLGRDEPVRANFEKALHRLYGEHASEVLQVYEPATDDGILQAATDLASARFIAYSTWKWIDLCAKTGGKPVFRYYYTRPRPRMTPQMGNATAGLAGGVIRGGNDPANPPAPPPSGAVHSAEIEYAMGNLDSNKVYSWTKDDYRVSSAMESYFANFVKTGDPNGSRLPKWPAVGSSGPAQFMHIDVQSRAEQDQHGERYAALDTLASGH